jgi:hypothetical protein
VSEAYARFVDFVCRRPRTAALGLALACLPALALTVQFFTHVEAGVHELLPPDAPTVRTLNEIYARLGSQAHLTVIAHGEDPAANRRFVDALGARLRAARIPELRAVQADVRAERDWLKSRAPLLLPADKFASLMDEVDAAVRASKADANPLFVSLDDERETPEARWARVRRRVQEETAARDRFPRGYLETSDGQVVVALLWLEGSQTEMGPSTRLMAAVEREVEALRPAFPASVRVSYTGDVANLIEEHDAILADLSLSSALVFALVSLLITAYFRSMRAVVVVLLGIVPGLLFTFALGSLFVGHLNSNTAFLGSIIAGNGINYPLLYLAYFRARPRGERLGEALRLAAAQALPGTLGAAATASAAYAGLAVSNFRGFSQFGWLGGIGMLTTWAFTFVAVPVAVALIEPPRVGERPNPTQRRLLAFFSERRRPRVLAGAFVAVALALAGLGVARSAGDGIYEMHLEALRNRTSLERGSASWEPKMSELFGSWVNPVVALTRTPAEREAAAAELRRTLGGGDPPAVDRVETLETYVPARAEQEARLARLRKLGALLRDLPGDALPADVRPLLDEWLGEDRLRPIAREEMPQALARIFREVTGEVDRTVLIYPSIKIDYADGVNMLMLARRIEEARLPEGTVVGGAFLFMADVFRLIHDEAPRVVLVVCGLVALVLVPFFRRRPRRILIVLGTVVPVAVVAQAIMLAAGVRINMLNFAAVPITIGVGSDYALNLLGAMDSLKVDARRACARMGGAILLCSLTTVVGYGSLLVAESGALRTFGWAAVLGEVMAVVAVLAVLPLLLPAGPALAAETAAGADDGAPGGDGAGGAAPRRAQRRPDDAVEAEPL